MKYMHFNSSCSYAGLANMMEMWGYDTEDVQIALDMNLPYLLHYEEETDSYQAGPMLQSAEWFNLYLIPRGFSYVEQWKDKNELPDVLCPGMMFGIQVTPRSKHAVVFLEKKNDIFAFLNNKYEDSEEEDVIFLSKTELLERLPERVMVGSLERCEAGKVEVLPLFQKAIFNWESLRKEVQRFVSETHTPQQLQESMNRLFRPILLDGITMMKLLGKQETVERLEALQKSYLAIVREKRDARLMEEFDCTAFDDVIDEFIRLIWDIIEKREAKKYDDDLATIPTEIAMKHF